MYKGWNTPKVFLLNSINSLLIKKNHIKKCYLNVVCQMQTTQYVFISIYKIKYNKFLPNN